MSEQTVSLQPPTGHDEVIHRLVGLLVQDRLPHALLFSGPDGIGKCLAAYWLAARVFCLANSDQPCGQCTACLQVEARSHPDLFVVERASGKKEIGIDLIRRLKRFVRLQAVSGRHKVAIVGEAERLSIPAQNGLLKTLEEPPGHALIMLVTPTSEALLPTVRSRCQRVGFRPLEDEQVATVLGNQCGIDDGGVAPARCLGRREPRPRSATAQAHGRNGMERPPARACGPAPVSLCFCSSPCERIGEGRRGYGNTARTAPLRTS